MDWQQWIPAKKVTAGAFAGAVAFLVVWFMGSQGWLTPSEGVFMGSAVAVIVAYLVPNKATETKGTNDDA